MINAIDVSGATKLTAAEIEELIYPFLGPDRSNEDVMAAQKALQGAYASKGYEAVLIDIPVQPEETFSQGIVQLAVNETPVGRVRVVGSRHHPLSIVRAQIPSVVEGQPINFKALQRDVAQANRVADRTVDPGFRPGQVPGTLDVDLKVDDSSPIHASLELNNDNSPNTKSLRLSSTVRYSDLFGQGHTLSVTSSLAPQDTRQSAVISASYNAPLIGTPWSFLLYGYKSNSNVAALGGTNVLGDGGQIGLRAIYRLPSDTFQQISFGADFKDFNERIFLGKEPLDPAPIRYVPLVAEYTLAGTSDTESYGLTFGATAGFRVVKRTKCESLGDVDPGNAPTCTLPGGGIGVPVDFLRGRSLNANENFVHFNLDMNYSKTFPGDYILALRFTGQLADSPLVTNEQFGIGGMTNVRGYYVSEAVGDDGFIESFEAQMPDLASYLGSNVDQLRFYAFGDFGYAHVRAPALGQTGSFRIGSFGGGIRYRLLKYLSGEFVIGVPVTNGPVTRRGDPRYGFSLKGEF
ncbi:ShlB/FhaC/HecB family hemolysin secretion/activation protein [Sphingomonas sp. QA11]|uniref:ShlB/FhaC/HecB family hemolysin secretion/activation protein n=1 Tax=Sphingomonas sp. QA11 TaxID=2950605 RepID=UPI00234C0044|nr:ShlB/FhaC/HecB family hemolysin secretion/activation protein [Sphingomonas sp. QA11]WCM28018.1 ShlB/FhaC/HecB family hemolysin secretion/activation protein [Sphingomonas sp. QA11]